MKIALPAPIFRNVTVPAVVSACIAVLLVGVPVLTRGAPLHGPDLGLLARQAFVIQLHLAAAVSAFLVALFLLRGAKGTRVHRVVGWAWSVLMVTTAVSSFFITEISPGRLSWIHILSGYVALATPVAVWAARTHRVKLHQRLMTNMVVGGLFIAGAFTFVPGRLMYRLFVG